MSEMKDPKDFLPALFDLSFSQFITVKIVKILFIIAIVLAAIMAIMVLVSGLASGSVVGGLIGIVLTPIAFLLYVLGARIWLELILVVFRIAENTQKMVDGDKAEAPAAGDSEAEAQSEEQGTKYNA